MWLIFCWVTYCITFCPPNSSLVHFARCMHVCWIHFISFSHQGVTVSSKEVEWYTSNVLSQRSKSVKRITEQQDKQPLQNKKTKQTLRRNSCCHEATKKSPVQKMSIQHSVCHRFEDAHIGKAKCSDSIHLKATNHQPECSQGSVSEGLSPPLATTSEMCPSHRIPQDDSEQREFKVCSNLADGSAKQLISHYDTLHFSDQPA